MSDILVSGVDRPGLAMALAPHGLSIGDRPLAALIADAMGPPRLPTLIEANDGERAAALLDQGADDVVLASDPDRLVAARLAALVRRAPRLTIGDLAIDPVERRVTRGGQPIALLPREYAVLLHLIRHADVVVSRAELEHEVLGLGFHPGTNVVTVHVSRLRAKLNAAGPPLLLTERGRGYRLAA